MFEIAEVVATKVAFPDETAGITPLSQVFTVARGEIVIQGELRDVDITEQRCSSLLVDTNGDAVNYICSTMTLIQRFQNVRVGFTRD